MELEPSSALLPPTIASPLPRECLRNGFNVEHHVLPNLFVSFIYNQAGSLVRWFRDTFAQADLKLLPAGADIYQELAS